MTAALVVAAVCGGIVLCFGLVAIMAAANRHLVVKIEEPVPLAKRNAEDAAREAMGWAE